ncbi:MAG: NrfD/PsrC family molybdoenzyme membrane anchor subunit [Anaerolineae bacterium]
MAIEMRGFPQRILQEREEGEAALFAPLKRTSRKFWVVVAILSNIIIWGVSAYYRQLRQGLGVTGLNYPIYWGMYIINTIFFIAISYGGTLTSAILRVFGARWRLPITRAAEVMTVCALGIGALNIVIDMGRPDRVLYILLYGHFNSPIVWDFYAVSLYLLASTVYLYLPLIPDFAELQHRFPRRRRLYSLLALGWTGSQRQKRLLEMAINIMAYAMVPIAISVHTVLSYLFSLTVQPLWHSALMGPYFVMGAVYSGMAALIIAMALLRHFLHLERYLQPRHFNNMGLLILMMTSVWAYFTFSEYVTAYYGQEPSHLAVFQAKLFGEFAPYFWSQVVLCLVIPLILIFPRGRSIAGTVVASVSILIGMWLERFLIIIPTQTRTRLPADLPFTVGIYRPTSTEWLIMAASAAAIVLLYLLFIKLFPIVSVWENREEREEERPAIMPAALPESPLARRLS